MSENDIINNSLKDFSEEFGVSPQQLIDQINKGRIKKSYPIMTANELMETLMKERNDGQKRS